MLPVHILHAATLRFSQAVKVRGFELAEIGEHFLGRQYDFALRGVPELSAGTWMEDLQDGIVILSAGVAGQLPEEVLAQLKAQNRALLSDWIGTVPSGSDLDLCDLHLFGSLGAFRATRDRYPALPRAYLTHHAELQLHGCAPAPQDRLRALWPGDPGVLAQFPQVSGRVSHAEDGARLADIVPQMAKFNLHVAIGPSPPMTPLLPVFAAAACGANVIVPRDRDDAVDYLGGGYPYLAEDGSAEAVAAMLDKAEADFDGPEWHAGLARMRNMKDRSSPGLVASDLLEILERVAGSPPPDQAAA